MMETVSYGEFSAGLHRALSGGRAPSSATVEVTRRCPLSCAHCYNNLPMGDAGARRSELSYEEHCRLLDEMAEAGCLWLLFTGGEIFARRDFLDIYTHAKRRGFLITLFTNGTLVTPRIADYLAEWRPFAVEITLYGHTRETYERLTGVRGSFDRCRRGIELLLERKLPLALKTVAVTVNRHEVAAMRRYAESLGVNFKYDSLMSPRIDCSQSPLAVRLTPEEVVGLDLEDPKVVAEWRKFSERFRGLSRAPVRGREVYHCGGGVTSFAVDPEGRMTICTLSHRDAYDLRRGSFREGWEDFLSKVRGRPATRRTKCDACGIRAMCGMCPANGELENGDPEKPVDFLCRVAHLRALAFDIEVPAHGECEYCAGGSGHEELSAAVVGLRERAGRSHTRYLPVLTDETSAGCSSCSAR
jgi:radical SAM protein with 4Fe4S-binding SPASM domain